MAVALRADVFVLCFSPAHPRSYQRLVDEWVPVVAPWSHVPVLFVATRMELTAVPEVHARLKERGLTAVSRDEATTFVSNFSACREAAVKICAVTQHSAPTQWAGLKNVPPTVLVHRSNQEALDVIRCLLLTSSGPSSEDGLLFEPVAREGQWEEVAADVTDALAERRLVPEWVSISLAHRTLYANRVTRAMELTMPMHCAIRETGEGNPTFTEAYAVAESLSAKVETYIVRKSIADADRRRATDASSRRSVGVDSVLELQHRHFQLQQTLDGMHRAVLGLDQRASQLRATNQRLRSEAATLDAAEALLRLPDPEDAAIAEALATIERLEAQQEERTRLAKLVRQLPDAVAAATEDYLAALKRRQGVFTVLKGIEEECAQLRDAVTAAKAETAVVMQRYDALHAAWHQINLDINQFEDHMLSQEAECDALTHRITSLPPSSSSRPTVSCGPSLAQLLYVEELAAEYAELHTLHFRATTGPIASLMETADALRMEELRILMRLQSSGGDGGKKEKEEVTDDELNSVDLGPASIFQLVRSLERDARQLLCVEERRTIAERTLEESWVPLCDTVQQVRANVERKVMALSAV